MKKFLLTLFAGLVIPVVASAHFQLVYTPDINLQKAGDVPLKLIFWHPMENGAAMNMERPLSLYSVFKGKQTDLGQSLVPTTFEDATAFNASLNIKRNGDYTVVTTPAPYYEESEDIYVQQITKTVINKGGVPTDWSEPVGLKTEILPLMKPYGVIAGSSFSGVVLSNGTPVANAEVEIEYMTAEPDMSGNGPTSDKGYHLPGGAFSIMTDANGIFTVGIPKTGFWGFAALGSGPEKEYKGKPLSQDAVLWIKAHALED